MADVMLDTICQFAETGPKCVRKVRIVIYHAQPATLDMFKKQIRSKGNYGKKKNLWQKFTNLLGTNCQNHH